MPWKIAALAGILLGLCAAALVFTMREGTEPRQPSLEVESPQKPPAKGPFFVRGAGPETPPADGFVDGSGNELTLAAFKGRPVLLNFWATWCAPCVKELPSLARLKAALGADGPLVVIINLDRKGGTSITDFLAEHDAGSFEPYADPKNRLMRGFRVNGLPTTLLLDANGHELARREGEAEWDSPEARAEIDAALNPR